MENILEFKEKLKAENFDAVVHCISYTEKHAEDVVSIFNGTSVHLIVLSSGDSYDAFQGLNRKIDKAELPITEDSPLSSIKYYWKDFDTKGVLAEKYDKNLMTNILMRANREVGLKVTVFRLSMIYGPGDHQYPGRHGPIIRRIIDKRSDLVLSDIGQCQVYTYGYIENVADAIVHSLGMNITFGKIYNLGEQKARSRRRWVDVFAKVAGWKFNVHILPEELVSKDSSCRNAPPRHLLTDSSLFCSETDFTYPIDLEEGVRRTLKYAIEHPEILGAPDDYETEDKLIESYYSKIDQIHFELFRTDDVRDMT